MMQNSSSTTSRIDNLHDIKKSRELASTEPQACASSLLGRHSGSIDWDSFSRFAFACGSNISNLEINNVNFKNIIKSCSEFEDCHEPENLKKEAEQNIKESFENFKNLQNLTLKMTKTPKSVRKEPQIHIAPHILSCSFMQNSLRILKLSLADFPENGSHSSFSHSVSFCSKLEELSLRFADKLSAQDINAISILPRLKRLGISNAQKLKSCDYVNSFSDTKTKFTMLNSLSLVLCSGIDVHSLQAILGADADSKEGGRTLQDLDIYADELSDEVLNEIQTEREGNESQSYLSFLKSLCAKYFAINVTLNGVTPGAFFKLSNLEKLDDVKTRDRKAWFQKFNKLRQLRCSTESSEINDGEDFANKKCAEGLPPSPPPEYSNFTVLDSNISCHIKSVPTVVLSAPSSFKCR